MGVRVKFGDYRLNSGRIIRLFADRTLVQYLIVFCSRPEAASEVASVRLLRLIVPR